MCVDAVESRFCGLGDSGVGGLVNYKLQDKSQF